jgi:hypothetical protein
MPGPPLESTTPAGGGNSGQISACEIAIASHAAPATSFATVNSVWMKPRRPPDDALLWRVETDHTEVVCFVVAAPDGGVGVCVERNEELMVAESYPSLERAIERPQELRAALGAIGLPAEGND